MDPPWKGGEDMIYENGIGHMTKTAAMPIYMVNTLKKVFFF